MQESVNKKIIQRALAKAIVHNTSDVILLVKKYKPINKNISYGQLLAEIQNLVDTNNEFTTQLTAFLFNKKRIIDYNNSVGGVFGSLTSALSSAPSSSSSSSGSKSSSSSSGSKSSSSSSSLNGSSGLSGSASDNESRGSSGAFTGIFSSIIGAVGSIAGGITGSAGSRYAMQQQQSVNTAQLMSEMMKEEQSREANKNNIIYFAIGSMVVITGIIIIFTRKK